MQIQNTTQGIIFTWTYKLITSTTTKKTQNGEKKYTNYTSLLPFEIVEILENPSHIYIYQNQNKKIITNQEPTGYTYKKIRLNQRKDHNKLITIPRKIFHYIENYTHIKYTCNMNKEDPINNKYGYILIELQ